MTDFWFNHFNVYWNKGQDKYFTTDYEMNAIRPYAMGKFKDLLMATAKSPAMLFYLDNHLSTVPNNAPAISAAARARLANPGGPLPPNIAAEEANQAKNRKKDGINENYGRELMELHTLGVDGGYTQKDVQEVARALTGWTIDRPRQDARFVFRLMMHDRGEKVVLGNRIRAGGGIEDGEKVIDILAHHPSTARFISTKLVRYFVSDNPPDSLVDKVAATFMKTMATSAKCSARFFIRTSSCRPMLMDKKPSLPSNMWFLPSRDERRNQRQSANGAGSDQDGPAALSIRRADRVSGSRGLLVDRWDAGRAHQLCGEPDSE
jgi:Uncharacterized protein conserved in bacteria